MHLLIFTEQNHDLDAMVVLHTLTPTHPHKKSPLVSPLNQTYLPPPIMGEARQLLCWSPPASHLTPPWVSVIPTQRYSDRVSLKSQFDNLVLQRGQKEDRMRQFRGKTMLDEKEEISKDSFVG